LNGCFVIRGIALLRFATAIAPLPILRSGWLGEEKAAAASDQLKYGECCAVGVGARDWAFDSEEDSAGAEIVRVV
jgi:hypothetical protein